MFAHLHTHTEFSLLDGLSPLDRLLGHVKDLGQPACAITDHGNMYGCVPFYQKAKKLGVKPILGCELYLSKTPITDKKSQTKDNKPYHLTMLAQDLTGYKHLMQMTSIASLEGFYYKPRVDKDILARHASGLICLSGCIQGEIPQLILTEQLDEAKKAIIFYRDLFGADNYFLEIQHHVNLPEQDTVNEHLIRFSRELGVPLVATNDAHYVTADDAEAHDALLCVQTNAYLSDQKRMTMLGSPDFYIKSAEEIQQAFGEVPEALTNTLAIAERCNVELEFGQSIIPDFPLPEGHTDFASYLEYLCREGIKQRFPDPVAFTPVYEERLQYELSVINSMEYASIFLIVWDIMNFCRRRDIATGPARGSAAASLVSYLLGITGLDPIHYSLLFERFLNPERISMPDIDIDFEDTRREEVFDYLSEKYGNNHVAQIITFGSMKSKAAIRDIGRVMGLEYAYVDKIAKMIENGQTINDALKENTDLANLYESNAEVHKLINFSKKVEGVARHASIHAAGAVISKKPLVEYVPLQREPGGGKKVITQYAMKALDDIGLLKVDVLGLSNLTIIKNAIAMIKERHGVTIDLETLPLDDKKTYKLLSAARTASIFQLESRGMQEVAKQLKPTEFDDIIAMVALYRPGPMQFIETYVKRKHGKEKVTYSHPTVEQALKNTYGVIVYQEQVMQLAVDMAGFTGGQADTLRKAMGKKIQELMIKMKKEFIAGCVKNDIDESIATKIFADIEIFAQYAFNKAHSAGYALIAYQSAYLKTHYPLEFFTAALNVEKGNDAKTALLTKDAATFGIRLFAPDITKSESGFAIETLEGEAGIRYGLAAVKNVGDKVAEELVNLRKAAGFPSLIGFCQAVTSSVANKKVLESLIKVGAFDPLEERGKLLGNLDNLVQFISGRSKGKDDQQQSLFGEEMEEETYSFSLESVPPITPEQAVQWEKELLGISFSPRVGAELLEYAESASDVALLDLKPNSRKTVTIGGMVSRVSTVRTKKDQKEMAFATIEQEDGGTLEIAVFPKVYDKTAPLWSNGVVILATGKVTERDGQLKLLCDEAREITNDYIAAHPLTPEQQSRAVRLPAEQARDLDADNMDSLDTSEDDPTAVYSGSDIPQPELVLTLPANYDRATLEKLKNALEQAQEGERCVVLHVPTAAIADPRIIRLPILVEADGGLEAELAALGIERGK